MGGNRQATKLGEQLGGGDKRYLHMRQQGESLNRFNEFLICLVQYFVGVFFVNVYEGFQS